MRRVVGLVMMVLVAGCPHGSEQPDPDAAVTRDGAFLVGDFGASGRDMRASLPGNQLPLDGGATQPGTIALIVLDGDTGQPMPATVLFRPFPGAGFATDPFGSPKAERPTEHLGAVVAPGVLGITEGVLLVDGTGEVPVPAGSYQLVATRGPEYEQAAGDVTVAAGERREVQIILDHTVDTGGWLSADLHVHSGVSFDSDLLLDRRVIAMVTSHVEIIVPTEHNVQQSFAAEIAALGYGDRVGHVVGNEFNFNPGHAGGYPMPYEPSLPNGGALPWTADCSTPDRGINCYVAGEAFPMIHALATAPAISINHPWWGGADLGYFTNVGWGAGTDQRIAELPGAGTFDAMEVLNGFQPGADVIDYLMQDWFALLDDGHRVAALGNSDSHALAPNRVGYPRNWLRLPVDAPADVTGAMLAEAVKQGRVIASTGPFLTMTVDGAAIGDTIKPTSGHVRVAVTVDAPAWIAVDELRIFVGGELAHHEVVPRDRRPRLDKTIEVPVPMGVDSYVVAIATSKSPMPKDVVGSIGSLPFAIANPVFLDGDGDSMWKPKRAHRRKLSGFDPRSVPIEKVLERTMSADHDDLPVELQWSAFWSEERARWQ